MYQSRNNRKTIFVIVAIIIILFSSLTKVMASDGDCVTPTDEQFMELRAVEVKEIEGKNKQVIMELWGNNVEFKRI